jgi:hypothetical protein
MAAGYLATSGLTTLSGPLDQYKHALNILVLKIVPSHGFRKVKQVFAWKISKEEVSGLLSQIKPVKSLVLIALVVSHMFVVRSYPYFTLHANLLQYVTTCDQGGSTVSSNGHCRSRDEHE